MGNEITADAQPQNVEDPASGRREFEQPVADLICERIASGESLRAICRSEEMPAQSTVFKWLSQQPRFAEQYARARASQMEFYSEEIVEISDDKAEDPQRARLRIDTRKWLMGKLAPKKYGDRTRHELTGAGGGPIRTQDLTRYSDEQLAALEAILGSADLGGGQAGDCEEEGARGV